VQLITTKARPAVAASKAPHAGLDLPDCLEQPAVVLGLRRATEQE
jgi:hypothetical protein